MAKKKTDTAYFYHNLVLILKKYIKSMTILKSFEKSSIWVVERNSNLKTLEVMLIWKKSTVDVVYTWKYGGPHILITICANEMKLCVYNAYVL